jgi:protein-S-isoprenylcysteine O-methyltransferase Ste14
MNCDRVAPTDAIFADGATVQPPATSDAGSSRSRRTRPPEIVSRALGGAWFLLLAVFVARGTIGDLRTAGAMSSHVAWVMLLSRTCLAAFYLMLWWLIITRPPPVARSSGLAPVVTAFAGTYLPWSISLFGHGTRSAALNLLSAMCLIVGMLLTLFTVMYLGRAFSIIPQARRVVQAGPYRLIKHPLYLSEEIAVLGTVLQVFSIAGWAVFIAHLAIQIRRILYEEKLLRETLPEYGAYAASRWRLLPYIW